MLHWLWKIILSWKSVSHLSKVLMQTLQLSPSCFPAAGRWCDTLLKKHWMYTPHSWALNSQQQHMLTPTPWTVSMLGHTAEHTFLLWRGSPLDTAHPRPCRSSGRQGRVWDTAVRLMPERDYWPGGRERKKTATACCGTGRGKKHKLAIFLPVPVPSPHCHVCISFLPHWERQQEQNAHWRIGKGISTALVIL